MGFIEDYLDRSAGLRNFVAPIPPFMNAPTDMAGLAPKSILNKGPLERAMDIAQEAYNPGHIAQQEATAAQKQPETPFRDSFVGSIAEHMIPGVASVFQRQRGDALADYASKQGGPVGSMVAEMMRIDPSHARDYLPAILQQTQQSADPIRQYQIGKIDQEKAARSKAIADYAAASGSSPIGVQGNNPLNIRYNEANDWQGQTGQNKGFATFESPENSFRAGAKILSAYAARGVNDIDSLVSTYAPAADNNDPEAYANALSQFTGISRKANFNLNDPMTQKTLLDGMQKVEVGQKNAQPSNVVSAGVDSALAKYREMVAHQVEAGGLDPSSLIETYKPGFITKADLPTPYTDEAKALSDYNSGLISKAQLDSKLGGANISEEQVKNEGTIRKEFVSNQGDYIKIRDAYNRVKVSAENPSAAGDMSLIFNYMKILDPGSTVREGEYATAANAGSVPNRVLAQYNSVLRGEKLSNDMRKDFVGKAGSLYSSQEKTYKQSEKQYRDIAKQYGFSPERVVPDLAAGIEIIKASDAPIEEKTRLQQLWDKMHAP